MLCVIVDCIWLGFQGRSKNVWESPKGCLLFSFTIQMEDGRVVPLVQYVVSLAMTEAVNDVCRRNVSAFSKFACVHLPKASMIDHRLHGYEMCC